MGINISNQKRNFHETGDLDNYLWQQEIAQRKNPMYKFLNLQGGGTLIDDMKSKGESHVYQVITCELSRFMYKKGAGTLVSTINILKYSISKYADYSLSSKSDKFKTSPPDTKKIDEMTKLLQSRFEGQTEFVCWEILRRGILGENLLHICLMFNSEEHSKIAQLLLNVYPNLCKDYFIGSRYFGQTPLHMAILNGNKSLVQLLIRIGSPLTTRARGTFFLQKFGIWLDIENSPKTPNFKKLDTLFYGEYPVSFAAAMGDQESYDCLLKKGASPNVQDTFGNTVLHILVINNRTEMYKMALYHKCPADSSVMNYDNLTPLALAASLGQQKAFNEIINLNTVVYWRHNNVECRVYPLTGLDSIDADGMVDWNSTLMRVVDAQSEQHLAMLEEGIICQLLHHKWNLYIKKKFLIKLGLYIFQLIVASIALYLRPGGDMTPYAANFIYLPNNSIMLLYIAEALFSFLSLTSVFYHITQIFKQRFRNYIKGLKYSFLSEIIFIGNLLFIAAMSSRLIGFLAFLIQKTPDLRLQCYQLEDNFIIISLPLLWIGLLFYASAVKSTGPCVTMIIKLLVGDILKFSIIFLLVTFLFSQDGVTTLITIFQMTFGEFKRQVAEIEYIRYPFLGKLIFVVFMILVPILLLNMLIAMIGKTYIEVFSSSEREWIAIWAKALISLERTVSKVDLKKFRGKYSIPFPKKPQKESGVLVMQINKTFSTGTNQEKNSLCNWKNLYRKLKRKHKNIAHQFKNVNEDNSENNSIASDVDQSILKSYKTDESIK